VAAESGRQVIVDSSKNPLRVSALAGIGERLRVIHLVRDLRGVAWSLKKSYGADTQAGVQREIRGRTVLRTAVFWSIVNLEAEWVVSQLDKADWCRIRYEDFLQRPRAALSKISALTGLDYAEVADCLERGELVHPGHAVAGNRVRMGGPIRLKLDEEWRSGLRAQERRLIWSAAGWLMRRYGYARSGHHVSSDA